MIAKLRLNRILFNTLLGILSGTVVQLIMSPAELVNTKLIIEKDSSDLTGKKGFFATFVNVLRNESLLGLYKGIWAQIALTINPGITTAVRHMLVPSGKDASPLLNFWAGAGSKAIASMITYPVVVAKVRMFTESNKPAYTGAICTLAQIVEEDGIPGLYKGSELQVSNAIIKEALLNMTRHPISLFFSGLLVGKESKIS